MEELIKQLQELKAYLQMYKPIKTIDVPKAVPKEAVATVDAVDVAKKKYTYSKERIKEYTRRYYLKNKEKILKRSTAYLKDRYKTDPVYREKAKGYSQAHRERQRLLIEEARKIVLANEAKQKVAYITIYNE
jgi:hypothetical protein